MSRRTSQNDRGFTLLELLIVIFILAVLMAIAVPNFLEAQTRAKVTRVKSDLRTLGVALEAYHLDCGNYPYPRLAALNEAQGDEFNEMNGFIANVFELTTPVAYLVSLNLEDPFRPDWSAYSHAPAPPPGWRPTHLYGSYSGWWPKTLAGEIKEKFKPFTGYCVRSAGPNRQFDGADLIPVILENPQMDIPRRLRILVNAVYDPSNGTISGGDILRWTGKPQKYGHAS